MAALQPRQQRLYVHRVIIWRETETFSADGQPGAMEWAPVGGSTITAGAASATQAVASTSGWAAGDVLFFPSQNISRTIASITDAITVVFTATITTETDEVIAPLVKCFANLGDSQQEPHGSLLVESDNLFTFDTFHFVYDVDLAIGDVVYMVVGPVAGRFWTSRGNPEVHSFLANMMRTHLSRTPTAPNGVITPP